MASSPIRTHANNDPIEMHYLIGEELGRGSFSTVYKAILKKNQEEHAVKVIDKAQLGPKKMEMIETEVAILKCVNHPNIIRLQEIFETPQNVYLVMELITGGELFDKIVALQSYSEKNASILVRQIVSAVDHLHENNIVHRDLKPENLLLSSDDINASIKLADFGLSTFTKQGEKLTKAVGTPGYIAPEILQTLDEDLDGYGKEVDMWSVGVIMYILLCGFPPFYAEDDDEAFDQIISGVFDYPSPYWDHISDSAKDLINHLLVVDPSKRYTAKQTLTHPWIISNSYDTHLGTTLDQLKKFNAKKRWKKGINTVLALGRFKHLQVSSRKNPNKNNPSPAQRSPKILQNKK